MEQKKTMTPKLRFPEFREDPSWEERKLSEVLKEHGTKSTGTEEVFSVSVHKGIINQIEHLGRSFSAANTDHYKLVLPGDVVYTKSPTGDFPFGIIKQSKVVKPVIVSPLYGVFTPETRALGCILDAYFESSANAINYLSSIVQKGAKNTINISNETFLSKGLFLPSSIPEQQKIAATLTSLDDLIAAQAEKVKALQAHKKGLMQQLFPAEGERVPRVRFPEFEGEWEEKRLGEVGEFTGGGTPSKSSQQYWEGNIPWISSSDISEDSIHQFSISRFITKEALEQSATKLVPANSILLVSRVGVGKLAVSNTEVCTSQDFTSFTPDSDNLIFMAYLLKYESKTLIKICQGMAIKGFTKEDISKLNLFLPSKPEQQKIAALLTSLDDLITVHNQKLEVLKAHKKGLMQQMFPASHQEAL